MPTSDPVARPADRPAGAAGPEQSGGPGGRTLLGFGAKWCAPWLLLATALAEIEAEGARVRWVDVDEDPALAETYRVTSLPTFVSVEDGVERSRHLGAVSREDLRRMAGAKTARRR